MTIRRVELKKPELRFPEFKGDWSEVPLREVLLEKNQVSEKPLPLYSLTIEKGITPKTKQYERAFLVKDESEAYKKVEYSDFAYNPMNLRFGAIAKHNENIDVNVSKYYDVFSVNCSADADFLETIFRTYPSIKYYNRMATGTLEEKKRVHFSDFMNFIYPLPEINEQQKIATFLTAVDDKLNQLRRKRDALQSYKRGVMQKIFSQEIRFTQDDGSDFPDWEDEAMIDLFDRVTTKNKENNLNVLTISAQQGLVNQKKYFNKSVSAKDVTGYYLLEEGTFAYNKSYSKGYPMGAIKRLKNYEKGVVSTLYICFKPRSCADSGFYEHYFEAGLLNRELHKIAQEGARNHGLLNMSVVEFFNDIHLPMPHPAEQQKIATFLTTLDKKIDATTQKITQTETFKKGLLQKMFV